MSRWTEHRVLGGLDPQGVEDVTGRLVVASAVITPGRIVSGMSVDLVATIPNAVSLGAVVSTAQEILVDLIGVEAPGPLVFVERRYQQGVQVEDGRCLGPAELAGTMLWEDGFFEVDVPATDDRVRLRVWQFQDQVREAVFSPYRCCVGVVMATGLALATARLAGGRFVDDEIRMLRPPVRKPGLVIDRTRLTDRGDFQTQCVRYLRQFPDLNCWPSN